MTPIERAARAMVVEYGQDPDEQVLVAAEDVRGYLLRWQTNVPAVRAVIAAIREPSESMAKAGQKAAVIALHQDGGYRMHDTWRAMIDKLLEEGE